MPRRSQPAFIGEFLGLDVNSSEYSVPANRAIQADNVFTEAGRIEVRPGRLELSEDQLNPMLSIGIANYTPITASVRSVIIVRPDGIFQRVG